MKFPHSRDLAPLFSPRSIAVVGASPVANRATGAIRNLQELGFVGKIFAVNPKYTEVRGIPCFPSLSAIPEPVDLACIGVPSEHVMSVLNDANKKNIPAAVVFASGFREAGEAGELRQAELVSFANRTGMLVCGPNCLGILNIVNRSCGYSSISAAKVRPGNVALVAQSGTIVVAMVRSERGIGFSHMVSSGNEAVLHTADYVKYLRADPNTKVIALFIEGINAPADFLEAAKHAWQERKPIIVLKAGRSEKGSSASVAHTGSLAGSYDVQRSVLRQHHVVCCDDPDQWVESIELFRTARRPTGPGIGIIGISGGENALVADLASEIGLAVPSLNQHMIDELQKLLPWYAKANNPLDITGAIATDETIFEKCLEILCNDPNLGIAVVVQDSPAAYDLPIARATVEVSRKTNKCIVFVNNFSGPWNPTILELLRDAQVPYLQGTRESLHAIKSLVDYWTTEESREEIETPAPVISSEAMNLLSGTSQLLNEVDSKKLLGIYGLPVANEVLATSLDAALNAGRKFGFPVVAKMVSSDLAHKAHVGGVHLNIKSEAELEGAYRDLYARFGVVVPNGKLDGIVIQPMIKSDLELIAGIKNDPQFGPIVLLGLGGVFVELLNQTALRLAPLKRSDAEAMVNEIPALRALAAKLLPGKSISSLLEPILMAFSRMAVDLKGRIDSLDANPILLDRSGRLVIVDALVEKAKRARP